MTFIDRRATIKRAFMMVVAAKGIDIAIAAEKDSGNSATPYQADIAPDAD
jgi:hypothetical protein